jgi:hypothetical protein
MSITQYYYGSLTNQEMGDQSQKMVAQCISTSKKWVTRESINGGPRYIISNFDFTLVTQHSYFSYGAPVKNTCEINSVISIYAIHRN